MKTFLGFVIIIMFVIWGGIRIVASIQYDRKCGGHLKRAADANTVELAQKEMETAIKYLEANKMTEGYTSIIYTTPDEDVGFWYTNLKSSLEELKKISPETSQLEKTNVLMKLRETVLDAGNKGKTAVTEPRGISVYPFNTQMAIFGILSLLPVILGISLIIRKARN